MPCTGLSSSLATTTAFPASTSTRARLNDTTASGSYPALRTRVRNGSPLEGACMACRLSNIPGAPRHGARTARRAHVTDSALLDRDETVHVGPAAELHAEQRAHSHGADAVRGSPVPSPIRRPPRPPG